MPVSISEAAAILGVSQDTIRRRIRQGKLQAEKIGDRWQVEVDLPMQPAASAYADALLAHIAFLETELEARRIEVQQLHAIIHRRALPGPPWWKRLFRRD